MPALQYNLRVQQGETFRKVIRWLDAVGQPKPIGNWTGHAQFKTGYGGKSVLDLSTQTGEIVLQDGYIIFFLTEEQTRDLPVAFKNSLPGSQIYYYDLFLYDTSGYSRRPLAGTVTVIGALTDSRRPLAGTVIGA